MQDWRTISTFEELTQFQEDFRKASTKERIIITEDMVSFIDNYKMKIEVIKHYKDEKPRQVETSLLRKRRGRARKLNSIVNEYKKAY